MFKIILFLISMVTFGVFAQEKDKFLPKGNESFAKRNYIDAEADYRISSSKNEKKAAASYNLGNAIYRQKQSSEAKIPYLKAIQKAKTRPQKHLAFHNLGNAFMIEKNYTDAVAAYKNALINNPSDEETRYNYALAKQFLKDNPPPPPKDDKKDKKDDKKDKKDQDKKDQDKKDEKKKEEDKKDPEKEKEGDGKETPPKDQGQPKPKEGGISKQRLENLLDAVNNDEKKVQEKVNARKVKGKPSNNEKDW